MEKTGAYKGKKQLPGRAHNNKKEKDVGKRKSAADGKFQNITKKQNKNKKLKYEEMNKDLRKMK